MTEDGPAPGAESDRDDGADAPERDGATGPSEAPDEGAGPATENAEPLPREEGPGRTTGTGPDGEGETPGSGVDAGGPRDGVEDAETVPGGGVEQLQAVRPPSDGESTDSGADDVPEDVRSYDRFQKVDRASYDRVNEFLRDRTYVTAREWAIARLCADFRTATGVEMTKIGEHLPELVPFMTDTYSPQAVNQARSAFERKVRMAGATFLYGAMSGFFTADELDELMYEVTEVAKFLLEVEGVELAVEEELDAEERISAVMREVRRASEELRYDEVACPHCGQGFRPDAGED